MKTNWMLLCAMIILMVFIAFRAYIMPITYDEVGSWFNYLPINLFSCLSNPECWGTANNHWLNSLMMQGSAGIFGDKAWALRLPNVLASGLYLTGAALISIRYLKTHSQQLAGFLLLSAHIYLLDFFSLARGYGLMTAGVIWGVYSMLRYIEGYEKKWLIATILSLFFSVLANFTALLPLAAIGSCWLLWIIMHRKHHLIIRHGAYWAACAILLLILLYFPIKTLAANNEFKWGAENVFITGVDLMTNLLYNKKYLGEKSAEIFLWIILGLNMMVAVFTIIPQNKQIKPVVLMIFMMIVLNIIFIIINQIITGANTPVGRKTIYLIPFVFGILAIGTGYFGHKATGIIAGFIISAMLIWHLTTSVYIRSNREWYFDAYYPKLFPVILPEGPDSDSIRMSSTWIFYPGLLYYQKTVPLPISGLVWQNPLVIDSTMDYYYLEPKDTVGMINGGFVYDTMIGPFYLYRNKDFGRRKQHE